MTRLNFEYYFTLALFIISLFFMAIQGRAWALMATCLGISFIGLKIYRHRLRVHEQRAAQMDLCKAICYLRDGDYSQVPKIMELVSSFLLPAEDVAMALKVLNYIAAKAPVELLDAYRRALESSYGKSERPLCKYYCGQNEFIRCTVHPDYKTCEGCKDYAEP